MRGFVRVNRSAIVLVAAGALTATAVPAAGQSQPAGIVVEDGLTQPMFSYEDAVREVVQVTSDVSSHDGDEPDIITVDIIRPAESGEGLKVPTIVIPSPYYSGPGRGGTVNRSGERKPTPPATPSVVAGDQHVGGTLMDGSIPLTGQAGALVDCGRALSSDDCPAGATEGAIALIERDPATTTPANLAAFAAAECSYTSPWESCAAINSGAEPPHSNPPSSQYPRWGTWPETGTHWIELSWNEPQQVSVSDIYWFQDSADGSDSGVKRPAEWSIQSWDGERYVDVTDPSGYGTQLDEFNRTTFDTVTTTRLRATVETRSDALAVGALEWRVYAEPPPEHEPEAPDQVGNAADAGAVGAVVYNHEDGSFAGQVLDGTPIPALAVSRDAGLGLLGAGPVQANLRELVQPIDFFPLYYDNYFVPRGYAVALLDLPGSRYSTGCLDVGGPAEVGATEAFVEWLAGNRTAVDGTTGRSVSAHWSNGLSALTGKSWDGTIPIAVAERAPEGLATIVPIAGLSHWHSDFWENGARYGGSPTQWFDGNSNNPSMRPGGSGSANAGYCSENRAHLAANQENPDPASEFWLERNWIDAVGSFEASVFIVHGANDYNVKPVNFGRLYEQLREHDVPRKMWISQVAHEKAFDFRRDEWLGTAHRWYDHWLHGIDNGITDEPRVDVEHGPGEWSTYDDWPNGSSASQLWLGNPRADDDPRQHTLWPDARFSDGQTAGFSEIRRSANQFAGNPFDQDVDGQGRVRSLTFLGPELARPVHVSGETTITVDVAIEGSNVQNTTISALLVDYGTAPRVQHTTTGGVVGAPGTTCIGSGSPADDGCYPNTTVRSHTPAFEVVTRGWVHTGFHLGTSDVESGETYRLTLGLQHQDYVFAAGHRIGIVIAGPETHLHSSRHPTSFRPVELDLEASRVHLPVVGGPAALQAAFR